LPLPQQRAHHRRRSRELVGSAATSGRASPFESLLTQQRVPRRHIRVLVAVGELVAAAESSSSPQSPQQRTRRRNRELLVAWVLGIASRGCTREFIAVAATEISSPLPLYSSSRAQEFSCQEKLVTAAHHF